MVQLLGKRALLFPGEVDEEVVEEVEAFIGAFLFLVLLRGDDGVEGEGVRVADGNVGHDMCSLMFHAPRLMENSIT